MRFIILFLFLSKLVFSQNSEEWQKFESTHLCESFDVFYKVEHEDNIFRFTSARDNLLKIYRESETENLAQILHDEISYACPSNNISLNQVQQCVVAASAPTLFEEVVSISQNNGHLCNDLAGSNSIRKIKFNLIRLFSKDEMKLIIDSTRFCANHGREDILNNYIKYKASNVCIDEFETVGAKNYLKKVVVDHQDKSDLALSVKFKKFQQQVMKDVLVAKYIEKYKIAVGRSAPENRVIAFEKIIESITQSKKLIYKGVEINPADNLEFLFNNFASVVADGFILHDILEDQSLIFNNTVDGFTQFRNCAQDIPKLDQVNFMDFLNLATSDCGGDCQNDCSENMVARKMQACIESSREDLNIERIESFLRNHFPSANSQAIKAQYKTCVSDSISLSNNRFEFCYDQTIKGFLAATYSEEISDLIRESAPSVNVDLTQLKQDLLRCLSEIKVDTGNFSNCKNDIIEMQQKKIFLDNLALIFPSDSSIAREFHQCLSADGSTMDNCLKLSLQTIQTKLKLNFEFDDNKNNLFNIYLATKTQNPIKALTDIFNFHLKIIKPDYTKNSNATYCRRNMNIVDTIVFHHTATSAITTPIEINQGHLVRDPVDPWLMVGYHYLIKNNDNANNSSDVEMYEGRPLDIIGAHAGSEAVDANYPADLLNLLNSQKLSCGRVGGPFATTPPILINGKPKVNTNSIAIAFIGNFAAQSVSNPGGHSGPGRIYPSDASLKQTAKLICDLQKIYPSLKKLGYHNLYKPDTSCPGWVKDKIGSIQSFARELGCAFQ